MKEEGRKEGEQEGKKEGRAAKCHQWKATNGLSDSSIFIFSSFIEM